MVYSVSIKEGFVDGEAGLDEPREGWRGHLSYSKLPCLACLPHWCPVALSAKCISDAFRALSLSKQQIFMLLIVTHYLAVTFSVQLRSFSWKGKESSAA